MSPRALARSLLLASAVLVVGCGRCNAEERAKFAGLDLSAQEDAFKKSAPAASGTKSWDERRLECVLTSVSAEQLSRFKFDLSTSPSRISYVNALTTIMPAFSNR
jgi:hypothetical protein